MRALVGGAHDDQKGTALGIVTTTSETAFSHAAETIYDFVTDPANWTKTYPGSAHIENLPDRLPLQVGDTWTEAGPDGERIFSWQLAIATMAEAAIPEAADRLAQAETAWQHFNKS